jgi:hypothetical protein
MDLFQLWSRMIRAARLEPALYEEVEADANALPQAVAVIVLSSLAVGVASLLSGGALGPVRATIMALVGWLVWAVVILVIGTRLLPEPETRADLGQLLRTTGFSASPGVLRILGFLPGIGLVVLFAVNVWMVLAMIVAVRQALDYRSTGRAVAVCLLGLVGYLLVFWLFSSVLTFGGAV